MSSQPHPLFRTARQLTYDVYYLAKPILPASVRFGARHLYSMPLRRAHARFWPIPSTCSVPIGWPGWPDGKRFAFVLSHDVEGRKGIALPMARGARDAARVSVVVQFRAGRCL